MSTTRMKLLSSRLPTSSTTKPLSSIRFSPTSRCQTRSIISSPRINSLQLQSRNLGYRSYATAPNPGSNSTPTSKEIRRNALIATAVLSAAIMAWYYEKGYGLRQIPSSVGGGGGQVEISLRTSKGTETYRFPRMDDVQIEKMLTEHEDSVIVQKRPGNPVVRYDVNWVGSNEPCEDRSAATFLTPDETITITEHNKEKDEKEKGKQEEVERKGGKDWMMFSVLDGHAGDATSQLLSQTLHPTLQSALAELKISDWRRTQLGSWKWLYPSYWVQTQAWTPENIQKTISESFIQLDENICKTPIRMLQNYLSPKNEAFPEKLYSAISEPAISGACAISTFVDAETDSVFVALAGDCRAVAGWEREDGSWRCDVLTEDQMGENPREVARMKSEHPFSESDTVIKNGRVQGGLQPTRAFGDAVYKWSRAENTAVEAVRSDEGSKSRKMRPWHLTPPYVTARPEITVRKIHQRDEKLKFIIMATDGLWDRITSEEATLLLASYLKHPKNNDIPKSALPHMFKLAPPPADSNRLYPIEDLPGSASRSTGTWAFEGDKNAATHLIRNSMAGGDRGGRTELLSLREPAARYRRDDVTVTVVFFDDVKTDVVRKKE